MSSNSVRPQSSYGDMLAIKRERDLLERMLKEKDMKIRELSKMLEVQHEFSQSLLEKINEMETQTKQTEYRNKIKMDNLSHEKDILKSQLIVLKEENTRIQKDPIHHALIKANRKGNKYEKAVLASEYKNPFDDNHKEVKLADSAQNLLLQSQLFEAMNSFSALKQQTIAMKKSYNEIVNSLQKDLILANDERLKVETELLSHMSVLGQEKIASEQKLKEQLVQKELIIRRLENHLQDNADDESIDAHLIESFVSSDDSQDVSSPLKHKSDGYQTENSRNGLKI